MLKNILVLTVFLLVCIAFCSAYSLNDTKSSNMYLNDSIEDNTSNSAPNCIFVDPADNDRNDSSKHLIQDAVDRVADGGTVIIYDGIYHENIKINKNVSLRGVNSIVSSVGLRDNAIIDGVVIEENCTVFIESLIIHDNINFNTTKGVGIYNKGKTILSGSRIQYNDDGVFNEGNLIISSSEIQDNKKRGIFNRGNLNITHSLIQNNDDDGVFNEGNLIISSSEIQDNKKRGIFNEGNLNITHSLIQKNKFQDRFMYPSGTGVVNSGTMNIYESIISHNNGTGIYSLNNGRINVTNSLIHANEETFLGSGGIMADNLIIVNCTITKNIGKYGGGIMGTNPNIVNCTIAGNEAMMDGGGVYGRELNIVNCTIAGNIAGDGGGIYSWGLNIIDSTVTDNKGWTNRDILNFFEKYNFGGGIYNEGDLRVINCKIKNNEAGFYGGGIYNIPLKFSIKNIGFSSIVGSEITGNRARVSGGGIYHEGNLRLEDVKIMDNFAWRGGGIYNIHGDIFQDIHTEIKDNRLKNIYKK